MYQLFLQGRTGSLDRIANALTYTNISCATPPARLGWLHVVAFCSPLCSLLLLTGQLSLLLQRHCLCICFQALDCLLPSLQLQPVKPAVHLHVHKNITAQLAAASWLQGTLALQVGPLAAHASSRCKATSWRKGQAQILEGRAVHTVGPPIQGLWRPQFACRSAGPPLAWLH